MKPLLFIFLAICAIACKTTTWLDTNYYTKAPVLYTHTYNSIPLNKSADSVTADKGIVIKDRYGFQVKPITKNDGIDTCTINVWKGGKTIARQRYVIRHLPLPTLICGQGNKLSVAEVKSPYLFPRLNYSQALTLDVAFTIDSFRMVRIAKNGEREEVTNNAYAVLPPARALLQKAKPGDVYLFDNIQAIASYTKDTVRLQSTYIEITE